MATDSNTAATGNEHVSTDAGALPAWAQRALAQPGRSHRVAVAGASIHYLSWNLDAADKPGLLLVHGFGGHARWWDFVAPVLAADYRVVAMDLGGMGDSDHRSAYDQGLYADEIAAVIGDAGLAPALLVAHSFGGLLAIRAMAEHRALFRAAVIVDSRINFPNAGQPGERGASEQRPKRLYPDYDTARQRFRLIPHDNCAPSFVLDHVARHSLREVDGGWQWKFDDTITATLSHPTVSEAELLQRIELPLALIYGEHSVVLPADIAAKTVAYMRRGRAPIELAGAHHHLLLDRPEAFSALLAELLPQLLAEATA